MARVAQHGEGVVSSVQEIALQLRQIRPTGRPNIFVDADLARAVSEGIAALATTEVYQRAGSLVRVTRSDGAPGDVIRCAGTPMLRVFSGATLKERLSAAADWYRETKTGGFKQCVPPADVVAAILERAEWQGIRPLVGITESPVLRADGSVLQTPGYDLQTGYIFEPNASFPSVPEVPSLDDARRARDELLEIVCDFPFATEAHRSAWFAAVLTPFARPAIDGCTPFVAIDAPVRGTGKSLLSDTIAVTATGRASSRTPQPATDEEMRKRITSLLREGESLVTLDNISRPIDYPSLDAALTTTRWRDRVLGVSETISVPNNLVWLASGNNLIFGGDIIRRALHIRLESVMENPERRANFRHSELLGWLRAERARFVIAAMTILRAYIVAGRPDVGVHAWGSFEAWSRLVGSAVVWAGLPDPQSTRMDLDEADPEKNELARLIEGLEMACRRRALTEADGERGLTAKELLANAEGDLRDVLNELCTKGSFNTAPTPHAVGNLLRRYRRRVVRGRRIDGGPDRKRIVRWWIDVV
jgi:hypothetical protein